MRKTEKGNGTGKLEKFLINFSITALIFIFDLADNPSNVHLYVYNIHGGVGE
jgi:hypothetical protein